jgi:putative tricarboxylic transport membrane protein
MATRDRWSALGLAALALAYLAAGRQYPLDTLAAPGPGVFPLAAGVALLAAAVWMLAAVGRSGADAVGDGSTPAPPLALSAVLVLFVAAVPFVGFLAASLALVVVAARLMGLPGWWRPLALGAGVVLVARAVFVGWLGVPLP